MRGDRELSVDELHAFGNELDVHLEHRTVVEGSTPDAVRFKQGTLYLRSTTPTVHTTIPAMMGMRAP